MSDLISRADAIEAVCDGCVWYKTASCEEGKEEWECSEVNKIRHLPSADAESDDLIIKGAKGIQDGLYNIKDGKLFKYKANGGTVRTYPIVPSADRPTEDYSDLPDIPRAYYEKIVGNMAHEINMLKEQLESADAVHGYTEWLEDIIVKAETLEWLCEDTPCKEWCDENCHYSSIQAECLRHLYEVSKGGDDE